MRKALEDAFGTAGAIDSYEMSGKTDWQIVTDLMVQAGIPTADVEEKLPEIFAVLAQYMTLTAPTMGMEKLPGVEELLKRLSSHPEFLLGLVTGNVREAVPPKLRSAGIDPSMFPFGAFGSEYPDRNALPDLALSRAEEILSVSIPKDQALIIGDTPRDIACARHTGVKVLCVATGKFSYATLAENQPDYLLVDLSDIDLVMSIFQEF